MTRTPGTSLRREPTLADARHTHRRQTHRAGPARYGAQPSAPAPYAARAFAAAGTGTGHDTGHGDDRWEHGGFAVHSFPTSWWTGWPRAGTSPTSARSRRANRLAASGAPPQETPR